MLKRFLLFIVLLAAACQPAVTPTPSSSGASANAAKQLATVFMSPTPDDAARQATRSAIRPTATRLPPTLVPSATPYVGVFIGEVADTGEGLAGFGPPLAPTAATSEDVTPAASTCEITPNVVFGTIWNQSSAVTGRLGCPIQIMFGFDGQAQIFERGVIYWRRDTRETWAIAPGGTSVGRFWYVAQPTALSTGDITAPGGLRVPDGDIGSVWKGVPGVRQALGYAQTAAQNDSLAMQLFASGSLLLDTDAGQVFALVVNGDAYGPY